jgi:hypothetical protein
MNSHLTPKISIFFVEKLRNSWLLRALFASNLYILDRNLLRSELIRGSLSKNGNQKKQDSTAYRVLIKDE